MKRELFYYAKENLTGSQNDHFLNIISKNDWIYNKPYANTKTQNKINCLLKNYISVSALWKKF